MYSREKGLALDLEGPLVDLEKEGHHTATLRAARTVGVELTFEEALKTLPHLAGGPGIITCGEIFELSDKSQTPEQLYELKENLFLEWLRDTPIIPVRIGLFEFLEEMHRRDVKMMIGTGTETSLALSYIERTGLNEWFPRKKIVLAEDVGGKNKPLPDIYLETARIMGIKEEDQVVVEDSVRGVTAGVAAGSPVVGLPVYYIEAVIKALQEAGAFIVYREWPEVDLDRILQI